MFLDFLKPLSFCLSIFSLFPVLAGAFFIPGARWEERLGMALVRVGFAGCICFASGLLFARRADPGEPHTVLSSLPVRLFFFAIAGMAVLFVLSWYLDAYYVPMASRDCCRL